jgi:hypothetical protein
LYRRVRDPGVTLDPIHVDNVARLASAIAGTVDETDHGELADRAFEEFLTPLVRDGEPVVEPLADHARRRAAIESAALTERPFDAVHGLDAGTINPTTFKNGLVVDVAHAAMAATPSNLDLHRSRTLVTTVHTTDATVDHTVDWIPYDGGYSRRRVIQVPRAPNFASEVVHELALYLAESEHALAHANAVTDLLVLDGPLYPTRLFNWERRERELDALTRAAKPRGIVENYVRLVERFVDRGVPLAGFVKNPTARHVVRGLADAGLTGPWPDDAAFFTRALERREDGERLTDELTFTTWFRSRGGGDATMAAGGDAFGVDRRLDPELYEVTFMAVYEPREDLLYRVEAPYAFTRDADTRAALTTQVIADVAAGRGPPEAVAKADALARIGREETAALRRKFEERFDSASLRTYDDVRWDDGRERGPGGY